MKRPYMLLMSFAVVMAFSNASAQSPKDGLLSKALAILKDSKLETDTDLQVKPLSPSSSPFEDSAWRELRFPAGNKGSDEIDVFFKDGRYAKIRSRSIERDRVSEDRLSRSYELDASGRWQLADDQKIIISNLEVWNLKWGDDKTPSKRIKDNWIYLFKDSSIRFLTGEATSQRRLNAELSTEAFKLASEALKRGFQ